MENDSQFNSAPAGSAEQREFQIEAVRTDQILRAAVKIRRPAVLKNAEKRNLERIRRKLGTQVEK